MLVPELPRLRIVRGSPPNSPEVTDDPTWEPRLDHRGRVCAYTRAFDGGSLYLPGLAYYRFSTEDRCVEALSERGVPADTITEAFYRIALPMALQAEGYEVLHASAVSDARGVHVLCGASRSGKSTIAYALGRRGFDVWADDAVAFKADDVRINAIPLPFALRLRSEVAEFFEAATHIQPHANGKTEVLRHQAVDIREIASVSLLERGSKSTIARLSAPASLPAVLYHAFYFSLDDPSVRRRMSMQFLELVARVPMFRVSLAPGLEAMTGLLDELEERVLTSTPG